MTDFYRNETASAIPVYADSAKSQQIGNLFAGISCPCIGEQNGLAIIMFKICTAGDGVFKVGFADAAGLQG